MAAAILSAAAILLATFCAAILLALALAATILLALAAAILLAQQAPEKLKADTESNIAGLAVSAQALRA